jgi:lysophospholipase L1-like esterase
MNRTRCARPRASCLLLAVLMPIGGLACDSNGEGLPPAGGAGVTPGVAGAPGAAGAPAPGPAMPGGSPGPAGAGGGGSGGAGGGSPAPGGSGEGGAGSGAARDAGPADAAGAAPVMGGRPRPARLVVLGDSIAACSNVGNENGADCSLKKLADYLKSHYAPQLSYENQAVGAAVTADVPAQQLATIEKRAGHALVLVYVGGNDLAKYMFSLDNVAEQGLNTDLPKVLASWGQILTHFEDRTRYPDGFTLLMNNQYNPFDDCTAAPYFLSAKKSELLARFNAALAQLARDKGAVLTDQYTPYLGHGHHFQVRMCPHFKAGATPFMDDLIHPNAAGHENLFQQWKGVIDRLYQ